MLSCANFALQNHFYTINVINFDNILKLNKIFQCISKNWNNSTISHNNANNELLLYAAKKGYENLCWLARDWGANDFNRMLEFAAKKPYTPAKHAHGGG